MARKFGQSVLVSFLYLHRQTNRWPSFRSKLRRTTKSPSVWALLRAPYSGLPSTPFVPTAFLLPWQRNPDPRGSCLSVPISPLNSSPCGPGSRRGTSDTSTEKSCLGERGPVTTNWGLPDFSTLGCIWEAFFEQG